MDILNFLKNLFQQQEQANVPVLHEQIVRTDLEKHTYESWKLDDAKDELIDFLQKALEPGSMYADAILVLNTPKSRGFMLHFTTDFYAKTDFQHLFDYLQERVRGLGYIPYMSDVKSYARKDFVEKLERHYLKPRFSFDEEAGISNQLYGNITIEHLLYNEQPQHIKFLCNPYTDRKWSEALPFAQLITNLLA